MDAISVVELLALVPLLALWVWCLVDVSRADPRDVRTWSKEQWLWIVALLNVFGAVMWLVAGRPTGPPTDRRLRLRPAVCMNSRGG